MKNPKTFAFISFCVSVILFLYEPTFVIAAASLVNALCMGMIYYLYNDPEDKPFISKHASKAIDNIINEAKNDAKFIFEDDDNALEAVNYMIAVITIDLNRLRKKD